MLVDKPWAPSTMIRVLMCSLVQCVVLWAVHQKVVEDGYGFPSASVADR